MFDGFLLGDSPEYCSLFVIMFRLTWAYIPMHSKSKIPFSETEGFFGTDNEMEIYAFDEPINDSKLSN